MLLESAPERPIIFKCNTVLCFVFQSYCNFFTLATFRPENLFPKFIIFPIFSKFNRCADRSTIV